MELWQILLAYFAAISMVSIAVCVFDKCRSKKPNKRRVPERTLLILCGLGGSAAMYLTMLLIRHKTRHMKFMLGIPAIMIAQYALVFWLVKVI